MSTPVLDHEESSPLHPTDRQPGSRKRAWIASAGLVVASFVAIALACACSARPPVLEGEDVGIAILRSGACPVEGETMPCHMQLGQAHDGVINCFNSTQTCVNGAWTTCGGSVGTLSSVLRLTSHEEQAGDLSIRTVNATSPSAMSSTCQQDPCDYTCVGIDVDAGALQPDGGFSSTVILGTMTPFSSFATAKCSAMAGGTNCNIGAGCKVGYPASGDSECNYDYCCSHAAGAAVGSTGTCVQWISSAAANCTAPPSVDLTLGIACEDTSATPHVHIPLCNRGATDATSGKVMAYGYSSNPNNVSTSTPNTCSLPASGSYSAGCIIDLSMHHIPAGKCMDLDMYSANAGLMPGVYCDAANFGNGNRSAMINPPAIAVPSTLHAAYGASTYTQLAESDNCNNYTFINNSPGTCSSYGSQPPAPAANTFNYTAQCPSGKRLNWNLFTYNTSIPSQSDILFQVSTGTPGADGGPTTFSSPVTIAHPGANATDPAVCLLAGADAGACSRNLATALGTLNAKNPVLQLTVKLTATTAIPTANGWSLTFDCIDDQ
jgi:hypothetical protein